MTMNRTIAMDNKAHHRGLGTVRGLIETVPHSSLHIMHPHLTFRLIQEYSHTP